MRPAVSIARMRAIRDAARQPSAHRPRQHRAGVGGRGDRLHDARRWRRTDVVRRKAVPTWHTRRAERERRRHPAPIGDPARRDDRARDGVDHLRHERERADERALRGLQERHAMPCGLGAARDDRVDARLVERDAPRRRSSPCRCTGCRAPGREPSTCDATGHRRRRSARPARHPSPRRAARRSAGRNVAPAAAAPRHRRRRTAARAPSIVGRQVDVARERPRSPVGSHEVDRERLRRRPRSCAIVSRMRSAP